MEGFTLVGRAGFEFLGVRAPSTAVAAPGASSTAGASVTGVAPATSDPAGGTPSLGGCKIEASCAATGAGAKEARGAR
ncbi:MAG: hypothetical protein Q8M79_12800, partial [Dehalococcoidia bacterium]|nr:hypothetical protein [Dehalococcoidia bacterium]